MSIPEKNQKESLLQILALILAMIFLVLFLLTIFNNNTVPEKGYSKIPFAIQALEPAVYADELLSARFPGVKLSILWEILYDQNIPQEELEVRIQKLEEQLNNPVPKTIEENTLVVEALPSTPDAGVPTTNPSDAERTITPTNTLVWTITKSATNLTKTATTTPSNTPTRTSTSTSTPTGFLSRTATSTYTLIPPTKTPLPPTPTFITTKTTSPANTPTFTHTWTNTPTPTYTTIPTQTYTFTPIPPTSTFTPIPPTLTFTPIPPTFTFTPNPACNTTNPPITISVIFDPSNNSNNVSVHKEPSVRFNQSMDASSFVYGSIDKIVLCEFQHDNTCPLSKKVSATIRFESNVYLNDTVIIMPDNELEEEEKFTIFVGTLLKPHPACEVYTNPISTTITSNFITEDD